MTTNTEIKTWEDRLNLCPSAADLNRAMQSEIADLRAALEAANTRIADLTTAAQRAGSGALLGYIGSDSREKMRQNSIVHSVCPAIMPKPDDVKQPAVAVFTAPPAAVQPDSVLRSATELARAIWRDNYKADAPDWEPLPDLMGVLSQIDNMVCGMRRGAVDKFSQPDSGRDAALLNECSELLQILCSIAGKEITRRANKAVEAIDAAMAAQQGEQAPTAKERR